MNIQEVNQKRAAVLWTGGKDCALALYQARLAGYKIVKLVTFIPPEATFKAHPLPVIECQAKAMGLPHQRIEIKEPYKESYKQALRNLYDKERIGTVITGDLDQVAGYPNWIEECCQGLEMEVIKPLWKENRSELLDRIFSLDFQVIFSCVKKTGLSIDWLGKVLDKRAVAQLKVLKRERGIDIYGEQGEYHTLVMDGPNFEQRLEVTSYKKSEKDLIMFMDIKEIKLIDK